MLTEENLVKKYTLRDRIREFYRSASVMSKIRYSYLILLVPVLLFLLFLF